MPIIKYSLLFLSIITHLPLHSQSKIAEKKIDTVSFICHSDLSYPLQAEEHNISGTVILLFDLDSNCRIINIRVDKSIGYGCDEEAIKALQSCNKSISSARNKYLPKKDIRKPFTFRKMEE